MGLRPWIFTRSLLNGAFDALAHAGHSPERRLCTKAPPALGEGVGSALKSEIFCPRFQFTHKCFRGKLIREPAQEMSSAQDEQ